MRTDPSRPPHPAPVEHLLGALADRTRLRLLNLMSGQEICVCYLVEVLRTSQPKISRHLARLRQAGIVTARREGKWMHYRVAGAKNPAVARLLEQLELLFAEDAQMGHDKLRLGQTSCAPRKFTRLRRAPPPALVGSEDFKGRASAESGE
ncbi:MAG TPA: metalloregulator ArsR/SmtB family transcription factor [Patescibacteria group bacterium]|nr:metalloregulator ArsR/SmtB family transcription factor [Patescibacteria group bacterium]